MRIATSTCISDHFEGSPDCEQTLRLCAEAGFTVLDMNFSAYSKPGRPLRSDKWLDWTSQMRDIADSLDIVFSQSHSHFYRWMDISQDELPIREELMRRSIIASGILGDVWMVTHPNTAGIDGIYSRRESLKRNVEYYKRYADLAYKHGVHIAIENLFVIPNSCHFGDTAEDILELIDLLDNDPIFGVCWDFGHAVLAHVDQEASLKQIGSKLKALHVDDNFGKTDEHFAPFFGKIKWESIAKVLKEINYQGDFTYEIHNFCFDLPYALQIPAMQLVHKIASNIIT